MKIKIILFERNILEDYWMNRFYKNYKYSTPNSFYLKKLSYKFDKRNENFAFFMLPSMAFLTYYFSSEYYEFICNLDYWNKRVIIWEFRLSNKF